MWLSRHTDSYDQAYNLIFTYSPDDLRKAHRGEIILRFWNLFTDTNRGNLSTLTILDLCLFTQRAKMQLGLRKMINFRPQTNINRKLAPSFQNLIMLSPLRWLQKIEGQSWISLHLLTPHTPSEASDGLLPKSFVKTHLRKEKVGF